MSFPCNGIAWKPEIVIEGPEMALAQLEWQILYARGGRRGTGNLCKINSGRVTTQILLIMTCVNAVKAKSSYNVAP